MTEVRLTAGPYSCLQGRPYSMPLNTVTVSPVSMSEESQARCPNRRVHSCSFQSTTTCPCVWSWTRWTPQCPSRISSTIRCQKMTQTAMQVWRRLKLNPSNRDGDQVTKEQRSLQTFIPQVSFRQIQIVKKHIFKNLCEIILIRLYCFVTWYTSDENCKCIHECLHSYYHCNM